MPAPRPLRERIFDLISPEPNTGCWLWVGALSGRHGYASMWAHGGNRHGAHRVVYEEFVGPIPDGLQLDHKCRTRCCVNPDHLEPVTQRVNLLRGRGLTATNAAKSMCPHGHPLSGDNVIIRRSDGSRNCRICKRHRDRARYQARKAEATHV